MTSIEWTEKTWNPVRGCSRISEGCQRCYAERFAARMGAPGQPYHGLVRSTERGPRWTGAVQFDPARLYEPTKWRKPTIAFTNSMSDIFHEKLSLQQIACIYAMMGSCPQHTFQVLTKRLIRAREFYQWVVSGDLNSPPQNNVLWEALRLESELNQDCDGWFHCKNQMPDGWPFQNVWLGVSAESQSWFDYRVDRLLDLPASVRWVSLEPLLAPIDMSRHLHQLNWVVVGGESGPGAQKCEAGWIESIVDQCRAAKVPCFVKQLGSHSSLGVGSGKRNSMNEWPAALQVREYPKENHDHQ